MKRANSAQVDLSGDWHLSDAAGDYACAMTLPGDGITALHAAGLIPDPYFGRNEHGLRWIADRDWVVRRTVILDDPDVMLEVTGLDCLAEVYWNGAKVLSASNAFRRYQEDLGTHAVKGENTVEIRFPAITKELGARTATLPFPVPSVHDHPEMGAMQPFKGANLIRKTACDFGWDWNIALAPFGVTGAIVLLPAAAPRIEAVRVTQAWRGEAVNVHVTIDTSNASGATLMAEFAGQTKTFGFDNGARGMTTAFTFPVETPDRWWPAGQGDQPLYDLTVTIGADMHHLRVGLREMEHVTTPDAAGASFLFRVNGRPIFAKGANWIPADALAGRITRDAVCDLLQSAVDAHMNMIRVWGGGRYEPDWFYDLCDEMGLMVWQDFMFACNLYPSTPDFLADVRKEVRDQVARLQYHACIALWCGDNELVGALGWFRESQEDRDRYLVSYDRLNRTIEGALREVAPEANWWPSSPSLGPIDFRDGWHVDGKGDMHFWSVWHENKDFDEYRKIAPRFCSEFGFQSYPSMPVIEGFTDPQDRNIASPVLESHQKNPGGNERIAATMFRYFRWPEKFDDFVWLSQIQQGLAIKTAVTQWRSLKPHCMGTLYWQLNDTWPVCSWSSLDHGGGWKLLHHMARRFYAPVTVVAVPDGDAIRLVAVNDMPDPVTLGLKAAALAPDGTRRNLLDTEVEVGTSAEVGARVPKDALGPDEVLAFAWSSGKVSGRDHFAPRPYKKYDLRPSRFSVDATSLDGLWHLTLKTEVLSHFATVEADTPGRFSDNALLLTPDRPVEITFRPADPSVAPTFTTRDLYSATHT